MNDHMDFVDQAGLAALLDLDVQAVRRLELAGVFRRFPMKAFVALEVYLAHRVKVDGLGAVDAAAVASGFVTRLTELAERSIIRHLDLYGLDPELVTLLADVRAQRSASLKAMADIR